MATASATLARMPALATTAWPGALFSWAWASCQPALPRPGSSPSSVRARRGMSRIAPISIAATDR